MARWFWMTGGLVVWTVQFCALYALASLADVISEADDLLWRGVGGVLSLFCLGVCLVLLRIALVRRRSRTPSFSDDMAALSASLGGVAVVWQALPLLLGA